MGGGLRRGRSAVLPHLQPGRARKKIRSDGAYVRRWVPELAHVPQKYLHEPWRAPADTRPDYPDPVVDHKFARERALAAFRSLR